jgi:hypothetical protein
MRHSAGMEASRAAFFCAATDFQSDVMLHDKNNPEVMKSPAEETSGREDINWARTQLSGLPRPEQTPTQTQRHRRWERGAAIRKVGGRPTPGSWTHQSLVMAELFIVG